MIQLKDFVTEALRSIVEGVREAQEVEGFGGLIAPSGIGSHVFPVDQGVVNSQRIISTVVQFDVAVVAETSSEGGAKAGFKVGVLGIGAGAEAGGTVLGRDSTTSRIRFSVPVLMPPNRKTWNDV